MWKSQVETSAFLCVVFPFVRDNFRHFPRYTESQNGKGTEKIKALNMFPVRYQL